MDKMKTTLLKNFCDLSLYTLGQVLEVTFRVIRFLMPVGVYNYFLQMKTKPTPVTALSTYLTPKSTFMFVAPDTILVAVNGDQYKTFFSKKRYEWNKNFPTYFAVLQCVVYACIIFYFIYALIKG
jgi:hypothetical protein